MGRYIAIIGAYGVGVSRSSSLICISWPSAAGYGPRLRDDGLLAETPVADAARTAVRLL
jgi:hypothetical protein